MKPNNLNGSVSYYIEFYGRVFVKTALELIANYHLYN